ncbi:interaptin-like [Procambarus clarkii]|uniref:interaptin-like n=1 Tax=Procambarus clarkii TaxID=6728 RepID=UPI0037428220
MRREELEAQLRREEQEQEAQMKREEREAQLREEEHVREVRLRQLEIEANKEVELKRAELGLGVPAPPPQEDRRRVNKFYRIKLLASDTEPEEKEQILSHLDDYGKDINAGLEQFYNMLEPDQAPTSLDKMNELHQYEETPLIKLDPYSGSIIEVKPSFTTASPNDTLTESEQFPENVSIYSMDSGNSIHEADELLSLPDEPREISEIEAETETDLKVKAELKAEAKLETLNQNSDSLNHSNQSPRGNAENALIKHSSFLEKLNNPILTMQDIVECLRSGVKKKQINQALKAYTKSTDAVPISNSLTDPPKVTQSLVNKGTNKQYNIPRSNTDLSGRPKNTTYIPKKLQPNSSRPNVELAARKVYFALWNHMSPKISDSDRIIRVVELSDVLHSSLAAKLPKRGLTQADHPFGYLSGTLICLRTVIFHFALRTKEEVRLEILSHPELYYTFGTCIALLVTEVTLSAPLSFRSKIVIICSDHDLITPEQQDQHRVADKNTLTHTHMKLKIELAQLEAATDERKQEKRRQDAALARERQEQVVTLQQEREKEQLRRYAQKAELERARKQARLQPLQQEADLQHQRLEQEAELQRQQAELQCQLERLQSLAQEHQLKRQQEEEEVAIKLLLEQGISDTTLEFRCQELEHESTHISQRHEAVANLLGLYQDWVLNLRRVRADQNKEFSQMARIKLLHAGRTVNLGKCTFAKGKVKYLGHVRGSGSLAPYDIHLQAILQYQQPTSHVKQPFILNVDASSTGIGGVLMLQREGEVLPVSYYTYKLKVPSSFCLQRYEPYLQGHQPITIYSDYNPPRFLQ